MRLAGDDLQHHRQPRTADERPYPVRVVTQSAMAGGPMKQHLDEETQRHERAMDHQRHHLAKHYDRPYDAQHGHDDYSYGG